MKGRRPDPRPSREVIDELIKQAVLATGVSRDDIVGLSTSKFIAPGRRFVWQKLRDLGFEASAIAAAWGCDPSTIHYALNGKKRPIRSRDLRAPLRSEATSILAAWPSMNAVLEQRARPARS